jgi:vanillate/3-O-methylgallate O-demethylase
VSAKNLQDAIDAAGNPVKMLRNSPLGPYVYPVVPSEFSNWRDEQRAWKETCVLFNQSYHMADMWIEGPDAIKLMSATGINSFENYPVNKAKQFVGCNYDGYVIGDAILFHLGKDQLLVHRHISQDSQRKAFTYPGAVCRRKLPKKFLKVAQASSP